MPATSNAQQLVVSKTSKPILPMLARAIVPFLTVSTLLSASFSTIAAIIGTVSGKGIDDVRIGQPLPRPRLESAVYERTTFDPESDSQSRHVGIRVFGNIIDTELNDLGLVWRIRILSPGAMTSDGLQVGSTAADVARASPVRADFAPGGILVLIPESECGIAYHTNLELNPIELQQAWSRKMVQDLPPRILIAGIILFGCK